ncbi:MAG: DUF58 domain-containing protein, partial [Thermodesulfobacteriota bacterium]|nr:DUF58 domain-containing protein [Thermodesulfobacteriota bacterium]
DVIAVSVNDPCEWELPDIGLLTIEDSETGEQIELNTSRTDIREGFSRISEEHRRALKRVIRSSGVDLLEIVTNEPYLQVLLNFFSSRKRRRH